MSCSMRAFINFCGKILDNSSCLGGKWWHTFQLGISFYGRTFSFLRGCSKVETGSTSLQHDLIFTPQARYFWHIPQVSLHHIIASKGTYRIIFKLFLKAWVYFMVINLESHYLYSNYTVTSSSIHRYRILWSIL